MIVVRPLLHSHNVSWGVRLNAHDECTTTSLEFKGLTTLLVMLNEAHSLAEFLLYGNDSSQSR